MARRRIKRSSLFTLVAVVALLSLGIGYAAFTETLTINSTINTADASIEIQNFSADEQADALNIGTCAAGVTSGDTVDFSINNAYPGYECELDFNVVNTGSFTMTQTNNPVSDAGLTQVSGTVYEDTSKPGMEIDFVDCPNLNLNQPIAGSASVNCKVLISFTNDTQPGRSDYGGSIWFDFEMTGP